MHLGHESVEMNPPLGLDWCALEEQVHQHGLAGAHATVEVEPLGRLDAPAGQSQTGFPAAAPAVGIVVLQGIVNALQLLGRQLLARIGLQLAGPAALAIGEDGAAVHVPPPLLARALTGRPLTGRPLTGRRRRAGSRRW